MRRSNRCRFRPSANSRATPGMFGAGYLEMLARQMTDDLQEIRDTIQPGQSKPLVVEGHSLRHADAAR